MAFSADGLFPSDVVDLGASSGGTDGTVAASSTASATVAASAVDPAPTPAVAATTTAAASVTARAGSLTPTRLYLTNSAPGYTPTTKKGAWDASAATLARQLGTAPTGTATTAAVAETSTTNNWDVLLGRWISDPMDRAGTLAGTVEWVIGVLESGTNAANANMFWHVHIYVTQGDTDTPRGTVLADSIGSTEFPTTATGRGEGTKNLTSLACQVGDRVVVEVGYQAQNTASTSWTGTINYGGTNTTDLTSGNTGVTTAQGWIEFSDPNSLLPHHVETLTDNFNDNTVDTAKWPFTGGTIAETGGQARVTAAANNTFSYYESLGQYALADSQVTVYMAPPSAQNSATFANARLALYDAQSNFTTYVIVYVNSVTGTIGWYAQVNGVSSFDVGFTPTGGFAAILSGGWYRIVESGGTLYFSVSLDGVSWGAPIDSQPTPAAIRASNRFTVDLEAIRSTASAAGTAATFDNLNLAPVSAAVDGATTAAVTVTAGVPLLVAHATTATATVTATGGAVITAPTTASVTVAGSASTPLTVTATTTAGLSAGATTNSVVTVVTTPAATATANVASTTTATRATTAAAVVAAASSNTLSVFRQTAVAGTATANTQSPAHITKATTAAVTATATAPGVLTGYRAVAPVQALSEAGAELVWSSADVFNGTRFRNRGTSVVVIRNTSVDDVIATFRYRDPLVASLGRDVIVPAGREVTTAVWPAADYTQADGAVWVDWTSGSGVSLAVVDAYPAW